MTLEQFDSLQPGDMVQHRINKTIKVIVEEKNPIEPITQITKSRLQPHFLDWKLHTKVIKDESADQSSSPRK